MGGKILEYSADQYYDAGKADGKAEGKAEGRTEGKAEGRLEGEENGERKMADLVNILLAEGKTEDIARVASDKEYRHSLYKKYSIV